MAWIARYAEAQHVPVDGCRSAYDVDNRKSFLNSIARGHENDWLKR